MHVKKLKPIFSTSLFYSVGTADLLSCNLFEGIATQKSCLKCGSSGW